MIPAEPTFRTILRINARFLVAALAIFYGWLCWQWTSPQWWGLGLAAIIMLVGGTGAMIATIFEIAALILRNRKIDAFNRQGGKARADEMARERDLKDRGIIR